MRRNKVVEIEDAKKLRILASVGGLDSKEVISNPKKSPPTTSNILEE